MVDKPLRDAGRATIQSDFPMHPLSQESKTRLDELSAKQKSLGKNINKKAMVMLAPLQIRYAIVQRIVGPLT